MAAALLLGVSVSTPPAAAIVPPVPDHTRLLPATTPAPTGATEPTEPCDAAARPMRHDGPTQLTGFDVSALHTLSLGAGQTVAVIDTGVTRHRLLPRLVGGGDYVSTGDGTQDCDGHGTIVAGIIAAAPTTEHDFAGLAPEVTIISIRQSSNVFRRKDEPTGPGVGDVDTLAMAVRTAADLGATVINVSSVACAPAADGIEDAALGAALAYAVDVKNAVVVAAAGNLGGPCPDQNPGPDPARQGQPNWDAVTTVVSPSWYDDYVLTVGSVGPDGLSSRFSIAGPWVDVAAPGEYVTSLGPDGHGLVDSTSRSVGAQPLSGTSYAAPVVSAIAALLRSRAPQLTAREVMRRIEETAQHPSAGWDPHVGFGVVDPLAAISPPGAVTNVEHRAPNPVDPPAAAPPPDPRSRPVALWGACGCLAAVAAAWALSSGSAGRLRRRRNGVARD